MGLAGFEARPKFTEVEKLALRYAAVLTATPVELPDDLFNAMRARFDRAFGCAAEGFSEGAFCPMPARPLLHGEIDQGDDQDGK
jgi:hypothetical protein